MNWHPLDRTRDWLAKTHRVSGAVRRGVLQAGLVGVVVAAVSQTVPACSASNPATSGTGGTHPTVTADSGTPTDSCGHPSPGCACSQAGETAPCGKVIMQSGSVFQCEDGTTTCDGTTWGACDGSIVVQSGVVSGGGLRIQGLGNPQNCGSTNKCDPYCQNVADTPPGIDAGANFSSTDAGLVVAPSSNVNLCDLPNTPATLLSNQATGYGASVSSCTGQTATTSDNCNYDMHCSAATGGTCAPYTDGATKVAGTCQTQPDFTLGLGCWASSSANSGELEVCNRGGVTASTGNLLIQMVTATPSLAAGSCPSGSLVPTGTPSSAYSCTVPLTQVPIGAGECITVNLNSPAAPITCTPPPAGQSFYAYVNPPTSFNAANTPIAECDVCNNYTAINKANKPTGATDPGQCVSSWCGVKAGASGGTTCTTNITGVVHDPGANVGLSNVAVYVATAAPTVPLPDEPAATGSLSMLPSCDTCASLSTPGYLNGVATGTDGSFTLPVTGGTYTLIAQVGRWRKVLSNFSAPACKTTPITPNSLDMPQCRYGGSCPSAAQGDIPRMAIVMGSAESLECWLAKIGVSSSEFAPYAAGNANRIDLFESNIGAGENYNNGSGAVTPASQLTLVDNGAGTALNKYSAVLLPCDSAGGGQAFSTTAQTNIVNYMNAGGRAFVDHWQGDSWIERTGSAAPTITGSDWNGSNVASWNDGANNSPGTLTGTVQNSSADQQAMYAWLAQWDLSDTAGNLTSSAAKMISSAGSKSVELVHFASGPNAPASASFWFNTPITASAGSYCGRVVYNDMHVAPSRGGLTAASTFPGSCQTNGLAPEELALEYEMFALSECNLGVAQPTPPPPPPSPPSNLTSQTFDRVFQANCPAGFTVQWSFFEWQASIPASTSISFQFATGNSATGPWGMPVPSAPYVTSPTMNPPAAYPAFNSTGVAVDTYLTGATPAQTSQAWLQVQMTLNPNGQSSPALLGWQQLFDCIP